MAQKLKTTIKTDGEVEYVKTDYDHKRGFDRLHPDLMGTITYDESTRECSIEAKAGQTEFEFFSDGVKYSYSTAKANIHADTTSTYIFYFDTDGVFFHSEFLPNAINQTK